MESRVLAGKISGQQLAFSIKPPNQLKPLQNGGKEEAEEKNILIIINKHRSRLVEGFKAGKEIQNIVEDSDYG